ncbi:MAG: hypothetical protein E6Z25_06975 [Negativicoccus succinicivorans]|uniref:hypothetical protein n=1 Tax=Negativicoccus succinicivorans TaxID=620903 RepID=UPI002901CD60|nr:hypothetical protein [Negativicoccus succinicivorans]MDU2417127.1 hypothetical protein [Negativicoccus succinicivorans]MDU5915786.1 hypothetical protein [Negativicoccus succinicivorans]
MTQPKKAFTKWHGNRVRHGIGFILGWLLDEFVWGLAIGILIGKRGARAVYRQE